MNGILSTNNVVWQKEQPKYKGLLHKKITEPLDIIQVGGPPAEIVFILFLADWGQGARSYLGNANKNLWCFYMTASLKIDCWNVDSKVELKKIKNILKNK